MNITFEKWRSVRNAYTTGQGSLAHLAKQFGLRKGTVERRAQREQWTGLRAEYEAHEQAKLIPPVPLVLPPVPFAADGAVSEDWLRARTEIFYRQNAELLDKVRTLLQAKLNDGANLNTDELARLTSALSGVIAAEIQWLGLRDRRQTKRRPTSAPATSNFIPSPAPSADDSDDPAAQ